MQRIEWQARLASSRHSCRAEHDEVETEFELRLHDRSVRAFVDGVLFEAECVVEKRECARGVVILIEVDGEAQSTEKNWTFWHLTNTGTYFNLLTGSALNYSHNMRFYLPLYVIMLMRYQS